MTKGMVDVLCSPRVRFAAAGQGIHSFCQSLLQQFAFGASGRKRTIQFLVDDTVHPAELNFNAEPMCYDGNSVFAFDGESRPTPNVPRLCAPSFVRAALGGNATTTIK